MSIIHAIEGPAGSGKSYWLECNKDLGATLERPILPRDPGPNLGSWTNTWREYQAMSFVTMMKQPIVVDRFLASRWVYRAFEISLDRPPLVATWYKEMSRSWRRLRQVAVDEAIDRIGGDGWQPAICELTFILPSVKTLEQRRAQCTMETGKKYPFGAAQEIQLYTYIANTLMEYPLTGMSVYALVH